MNINKTADECITELGIALLYCFADSNLLLIQKKAATKWITYFLDYQDAISKSNKDEIKKLSNKLTNNYSPLYYYAALKEFNNANLIYNNAASLKELKTLVKKHSTKKVFNVINDFSNIFISTIKKYESYFKNNEIIINKELSVNIKLLFLSIHYHISYIFQKELIKIVKLLIKILKTKVQVTKTENTLLKLILTENHEFFQSIQQIQLINFIHSMDDILTSGHNISSKIETLIFSKPKKLEISLNNLLKKHNIFMYKEIWKNNKINNKKSNLIMHMFAYETYFVQANNNHKYYEELILSKIMYEEKYNLLLHEYKTINKIHHKV